MHVVYTFKEMFLGGKFGFITTNCVTNESLTQLLSCGNYVYFLSNKEGSNYILTLYGGKLSPTNIEMDVNVIEKPLGVAIFNEYPNSPTIRLNEAEKAWLFSPEGKTHVVSQESLELGIQTLFDKNLTTIQTNNLIAYSQDIIGRFFYIFDKHFKLHSFKCVDIKHTKYRPLMPKKSIVGFVIGSKTNQNVSEKYSFFFTNASQYKIITVCIDIEGNHYVENGNLYDSMIFSTQNAAIDALETVKQEYIKKLDACKYSIKEGSLSELIVKVLQALDEI